MDVNAWLTLAVALYTVTAILILGHAFVVRRADLFDPLVQCVLFISLFTLPLPIRALTSDLIEGDVTEHLAQLKPFLPISVVYAAMGLAFLAIGYYSGMAVAFGRKLPHPPMIRRPRVYTAATLIAVFSLFLISLLTAQAGGIIAFVLLGYGSSAETFGRGYLAIGFPWLFVSSLLLLYRYSLTRRTRDLALFIIVFAVLSVVQLLLGNRSTIMYMGLAVASFVHYSVRKLRLQVLAPLAIVGFVGLNVFGYLRGSGYESFRDLGARSTDLLDRQYLGRQSLFYTLTTGEFVVPFETLPEMVRSVGTKVMPRLGATFARAPLFVVPGIIYPDRPLPLANWYMAQFYGTGFGLNQGRAFFFLAEGYLNFGPAGIVLLSLAWGVFWGGVREYARLGSGNPGSALLVALSLAFIFRAVGGDFVTLLIALPEQSLSAAVIGLMIASGGATWYRRRSAFRPPSDAGS